MRDFLLNEALKRLATEAATRLSTLVAGGEQIPFDVAAEDGDDSAFYSYVPLTGRYVVEHADELRSLPSFAPAREAAVEAGVAAPYLEARGEIGPRRPGRARRADADRLLRLALGGLAPGSRSTATGSTSALSMLDAEGARRRRRRRPDRPDRRPADVGRRGCSCRTACASSAPTRSRPRSRRCAARAWAAPPGSRSSSPSPSSTPTKAPRRPCSQLRELISVMRLFKGGGIGLGPYAFAPTGADCWRRIATGAPATRPGGYRLSEAEAERAGRVRAATLESRPDPDSALTWAVGRFEMGCERESALDGLSDHLLALRAVLEGHGPVGASLPMRAAALICRRRRAGPDRGPRAGRGHAGAGAGD